MKLQLTKEKKTATKNGYIYINPEWLLAKELEDMLQETDHPRV